MFRCQTQNLDKHFVSAGVHMGLQAYIRRMFDASSITQGDSAITLGDTPEQICQSKIYITTCTDMFICLMSNAACVCCSNGQLAKTDSFRTRQGANKLVKGHKNTVNFTGNEEVGYYMSCTRPP